MDLWTSWGLLFVLGIPDPGAHCFPEIALYRPSLKDCQVYRDTLRHLLSTISSTFFNGSGQLALWHRSKALLLATGWIQPTVSPLEMFMFTTPDKASLKSEMGGVMITGSSLASLKKWGPEKSRLFKDPVARDQADYLPQMKRTRRRFLAYNLTLHRLCQSLWYVGHVGLAHQGASM